MEKNPRARRTATTVAAAVSALLAMAGAAHADGLLSRSSADSSGSSATAVEVGPIAVSQAESGSNGSNWNAVKVGNTVVLGKSAEGWHGTLAPAGSGVDTVNDETCGYGSRLCVAVLQGSAWGPSYGTSAEGSILAVRTDTSLGPAWVEVAPAGTSAFGFYGGYRCTEGHAALVATHVGAIDQTQAVSTSCVSFGT